MLILLVPEDYTDNFGQFGQKKTRKPLNIIWNILGFFLCIPGPTSFSQCRETVNCARNHHLEGYIRF